MFLIVGKAVEIEAIFAQEFRSNLAGLQIGIRSDLLGSIFVKTIKIKRVVFDGFTGATVFDLDGFEKIGD